MAIGPLTRLLKTLVLGALAILPAVPSAQAGLYHYPWCETVRERCYAKALVRKAECNWRYNYAKTHELNGLSKWPKGTANYCYIYSDSHPQATAPTGERTLISAPPTAPIN